MKKVMILSAVALALSFATPQVANAMTAQNEIAINQEKEVKFTEIKVEELPEAVSKSIVAAYPRYKVEKAFPGDDATFKVKVSLADVKQVLFHKASGELIKIEEPATK